MRTFKFSAAICAIAVCSNFISVRADDTPAQAAARAALEQKMQQLDTQPAATTAETPPILVTPSGATQEQPATPTPAENPATAPIQSATSSQPSLDTSNVPTAEIIQHSMMPLPEENQPAKISQAPAPPAITTPAPIETPAATTPPAEMQPAPATTPADADHQAEALQALQQKMSELDNQQAATPPPAATEIQPPPSPAVVATPPPEPVAPEIKTIVTPPQKKPDNVNYAGKELNLKPIEAPSLPISADKEARLQALLAKYKADQVSPEEYHTQRAEILAEP
jgi:hypothetical protein